MDQKKRLLLFFGVQVLFNMAASFAHPVTPTIFTNLNLGSYMFGVALAAMMSVQFLFSPFWGKINGYISSRVSLLISCGGYALGQLMFGLARTEMGFILARMVAGIFTGGNFVSLLTYVVNTAPDEQARGRNLTITATIQSVAGAFGYFVGGMLGEISVYLAIGAQVTTLALCGVGFYLVCEKDTTLALKDLQLGRLVREANPFACFVESRKFMTVMLACLFAVCSLQNLGFTAFDQSFNYYIRDQFHFSSGYNGILKGVMGMITLIANGTICIWLVKKTDVKRSIIGVLALCTAAMLGVVVIEQVVAFIVTFVVYYAFNSVSIPLLQDMVAHKATGRDSNLIMGFYNSMKSLGGIFGALISGVLYTQGPRLPFVFGCASFALATVLALAFYSGEKKGAASKVAQE